MKYSPCPFRSAARLAGFALALGLLPVVGFASNVDYLIVGGGGGGGGALYGSGGGGGGGVRKFTGVTLTSGTYAVVVGNGGAVATNGSDSSFNGVTSIGGGHGAYYTFADQTSGGSGGGGRGAGPTNGAAGTAGQGYAGGNGSSTGLTFYSGGGGGGATAVGGNGLGGSFAGAGGEGLADSISGTSKVYGSGGGGGYDDAGQAAGGTNAGTGADGFTDATVPLANFGGGGGGGSINNAGSAGAKGVVIIRYSGSQVATGGTITSSGGYTIHTFTSSGTFTLNNTAPVISSATTASAAQGQSTSYTITASNSPTSFAATSLPAGLSVNTTTGVISGTPTGSTGTTNSTITATNASGSDSKTLVWTITSGTPVINSATTASGIVGASVSYTITATNTPTSFAATGLPGGLSVNTTTGAITGMPTTAGSYSSTISATNATGTGSATVLWTVSGPSVLVTPANTGTAVVNGNVGMGTSTPLARLHVLGNVNGEIARFQPRDDAANFRSFISLYSTNPGYWWEFSVQDEFGNGTQSGFALRAKWPPDSITKPRLFISPPGDLVARSFMRLYNQNPDFAWEFSLQDPDGGGTTNGLALREMVGTGSAPRLYIQSGTGNVGIGTTNPTTPLAVNGTIRAKEVIVDTGWADFVFAEDYTLAPLSEVEAHIKEQGHLPGIPSAAEVAAGGVSLGDMQAKLLQKIEELTLHQISQEKRIQKLEAENAALRAR